ncbi:MAG: FAD-dependent oxidoreductase, partial [Marinoscillum sp.]
MRLNSKFLAIIVLTILFAQYGCVSPANDKDADVVIYGGTSAAITAAVQLAQMDKSVLIVCPEKHIGGMSSSGLGFTDVGDKRVIGGLSREFYHRVYQHYQNEEAWKWQPLSEYGNEGQGTTAINDSMQTMWTFEPHVAEQIFEDFIAENNITVLRDEWLDREKGVVMNGKKIKSITMLSGKTFKADVFMDATYEGDLMAAAGVSYHVGREANSVYNETWNGVQKGHYHHSHNFQQLNISPYIIPGDSTSGVLPRISTKPPGANGSGDEGVQ